jgi:ubiquinone/menaquinone biosynthesis C-methylase UbiE
MNGLVTLEDSFITITTGGVASKMEVVKQQDYGISKVYRVVQPEGSDYEIRISFTINELVKKDKYLLSYEMKDHFRNEISTLVYYLIPTK